MDGVHGDRQHLLREILAVERVAEQMLVRLDWLLACWVASTQWPLRAQHPMQPAADAGVSVPISFTQAFFCRR